MALRHASLLRRVACFDMHQWIAANVVQAGVVRSSWAAPAITQQHVFRWSGMPVVDAPVPSMGALRCYSNGTRVLGMPVVDVPVPSMGESITEGSVAAVLVQNGQQVAMDDIILQIETDKVTIDVRAPQQGVMTSVLVRSSQNAVNATPHPCFRSRRGTPSLSANPSPSWTLKVRVLPTPVIPIHTHVRRGNCSCSHAGQPSPIGTSSVTSPASHSVSPAPHRRGCGNQHVVCRGAGAALQPTKRASQAASCCACTADGDGGVGRFAHACSAHADRTRDGDDHAGRGRAIAVAVMITDPAHTQCQ